MPLCGASGKVKAIHPACTNVGQAGAMERQSSLLAVWLDGRMRPLPPPGGQWRAVLPFYRRVIHSCLPQCGASSLRKENSSPFLLGKMCKNQGITRGTRDGPVGYKKREYFHCF